MAILAAMKFDNVAFARKPQLSRKDRQASHDQCVAPAFSKRFIVRTFVHDVALNRQDILSPNLFDMYKRPLPAAKRKMLIPDKAK